MLELHVFGPAFGQPDPSPFCMKGIILMEMSGLPYRRVRGNLQKALLARELAEAPAARRALLDGEDPLGTLRREIRAAGCASVRDVNLPGISAVAAPLHDYTGHVVGVLCALGASGGFDPDPQGAVARALLAEAVRVSASLGYLSA